VYRMTAGDLGPAHAPPGGAGTLVAPTAAHETRRMRVLLGGLAVLLAVIWLVTIGDLVRRRLGTQRTIGWLLIVVIVPYAGAAVYRVLRKPEDTARRPVRGPRTS
jgi:type IV secretory pathway VirB2 component (pilin)